MRTSVPQPLRALRTLIREARKAERDDPQHRTAGEILFGSVTYSTKKGRVKHLHILASQFDEFIDAMEGNRGKDNRT